MCAFFSTIYALYVIIMFKKKPFMMSAISPLTFQLSHTKQSLRGFKMAAGLGVGFLTLVSELKTLKD